MPIIKAASISDNSELLIRSISVKNRINRKVEKIIKAVKYIFPVKTIFRGIFFTIVYL
jgi:hypothetical protein